jgi:hypothetical protein
LITRFTLKGVMGSRNGADAYFKDMENMRLKYEIQNPFRTTKMSACFMTLQCLVSGYSVAGGTVSKMIKYWRPGMLTSHS